MSHASPQKNAPHLAQRIPVDSVEVAGSSQMIGETVIAESKSAVRMGTLI